MGIQLCWFTINASVNSSSWFETFIANCMEMFRQIKMTITSNFPVWLLMNESRWHFVSGLLFCIWLFNWDMQATTCRSYQCCSAFVCPLRRQLHDLNHGINKWASLDDYDIFSFCVCGFLSIINFFLNNTKTYMKFVDIYRVECVFFPLQMAHVISRAIISI